MFKKQLCKPDGRPLYLYSRTPISDTILPTNPKGDQDVAQPHLRWHPLRAEWVAYASHRQNRTFLPPKDYSPLSPTQSEEFPTEMPAGNYEIAVFENLFPSFNEATCSMPELAVPTRPAKGVCEVVVFTQDADTSLGNLSVDRIQLVLEVLAERCLDLGKREGIQYVLPFENRGVEMGVTLHHPHGQIYGYPFVPPIPALMQSEMVRHYEKKGEGLLAEMIRVELHEEKRMIVQDRHSVSFVPVCARYPYETWVAPIRECAHLHELHPEELSSLAQTLKSTIQKHDALWKRPQPYLMVMFQAPFDGQAHPESHVHFQIYPPYRTRDRLKYLAGTELGAGVFINDSLPEEKALELRNGISQ